MMKAISPSNPHTKDNGIGLQIKNIGYFEFLLPNFSLNVVLNYLLHILYITNITK